MMRRLYFYKESDHRWYVDLPECNGVKEELEMVAGADLMLEYMSDGDGFVWLVLAAYEFDGSDELELLREDKEIGNGAYYILKTFKTI